MPATTVRRVVEMQLVTAFGIVAGELVRHLGLLPAKAANFVDGGPLSTLGDACLATKRTYRTSTAVCTLGPQMRPVRLPSDRKWARVSLGIRSRARALISRTTRFHTRRAASYMLTSKARSRT